MSENELQHTFRAYQRTADPALLTRIFDAKAADLLALARHLVADEASAEDAVQATFLTAMEKAQRYDSRRPLSPWLAGILARHARRARRSASRRPDARRAKSEPVADPAEEVQGVEVREQLGAALGRLAPIDREVLRPFLIEAQRPAAIAVALGISPNATYVRLHRALARLRRALPAGLAPAALLVPGRPPRGLAAVREVLVRAGADEDAAAAEALRSAAPAGTVTPLSAALLAVLVATAALFTLTGSGPVAQERGSARAIAGTANRRGAPTSADRVAMNVPAATGPRSMARVEGFSAQAPSAPARVSYRGVVARSDGQVLAAAQVWLTDASDGSSAARRVATSDARGRYRFEAEPGAHERLRIHKLGFADFRVPAAPRMRELALQELGVNVREDGETWLGMANLRYAALVSGRVRDADGAPVAGAMLSVFRPNMDPRGDWVDGVTRADGSFTLEGGVPWRWRETEGPWILCATSTLGSGWAELVVPRGTAELADVHVVLRAGRDLDVLVVDGDGAPVTGVSLRAVPNHGPWARVPERFMESEPLPTDERFGAVSGKDGIARFRALPLFEGPESNFAGSVTIEGSPVTIYRMVAPDPIWRVREAGYFPLGARGSAAEAHLMRMGVPGSVTVEPQPAITRK